MSFRESDVPYVTSGWKNAIKLNPLSPNMHIQILQTDLYTFPLRVS